MKVPRTLPLLLALTLLSGQQAAFAHALSHVGPGAPSKAGLAHTNPCAKCVTFGQLSSVVPTGATVDPVQPAAAPPSSALGRGISLRTVTAFRSRAPPLS